MKKHLLFLTLAVLVSSSTLLQGQTTIFNADFNNGAGDNAWLNQVGSEWTRGTDATAHGVGSYLHITRNGGTGLYNPDSDSYIDSPVIDLAGFELLQLSLRVNLDTEASFDGLRIMFSTDGGVNYYPLGKNDDEAINWYNSDSVDALGSTLTRGWSGDINWFTATIDLPSQGFDNKSDIRFQLHFASDNVGQDIGVAVDDFTITGYPITAKTYPNCSASNIGDKLELWLNPAVLGGLNDGDKVDRWPNASGINPDWTDAQASGAQRPTYVDNATENVNFNPVVSFENTNAMFGRQGFYNKDIFLAIKPGSPIFHSLGVQDVFMGDDYLEIAGSEDVTGISLNNTSSRYGATAPDIVAYNQGANTSYGRAIVSDQIGYTRPVIFNARLNAAEDGMDLFLDGINLGITLSPALVQEANVNTFKNILNSRYWLGRSEFFGPSFDGDILEIMVFSERKSDLDRKRIESYLALKYGITLGLFPDATLGLPHIPGEYFNSAGVPLWNTTLHNGYTYNVAGIGRDDCALLNQKQAKSVDPNTFLTVGLGDIFSSNTANTNNFATDGDFLMWGSTPSTLMALPSPVEVDLGPSLVTTFTEVTERTWKFVETATTDIPTVKLSVSTAGLTALPALVGNDAYVMIVADDDAFTTNVETVFLTTNGADQECFYDFDGTKYIKYGVAHEVISPRHIDFDGINDFVKIGDELSQTGSFTISGWVNVRGANNDASEKTIVSKADATNNGYHFYVDNTNRLTMRFGALGPQNIVSNTVLNTNQWRHVAYSFDGTTGKLYIDGVEDNSKVMTAPVANNTEFSIGARYLGKSDIRNYFAGSLDEIRLYDGSLSVEEIRFTMNQEIEQVGALVDGSIIKNTVTKNDLNNRAWSSIQAYYNMNTYIGTHLNDASGNAHRGALLSPSNFNIETQTAPLPYKSTTGGDWDNASTWENGAQMYAPNSTLTINGVNTVIDWNIVNVRHEINTTTNNTVLGLISDSDRLSINNGSKLEVSHYLKLDGEIDLVGRSQLVQTINSDLDVTSAGFIERDQQGQTNVFNYNYLSSPVSAVNTTANNTSYTLDQNLKDASDPMNLENIIWTDDYDGVAGSPITLSRYWLYKYINTADNYYNWVSFNETDLTLATQGFIMKGSGAATATQNYTFVGKPNNGLMTSTIGANNSSLVGNPYPSALNATTFIGDNSGSITGTLYFWEHFNTNNTHITKGYQGGYAMRNLTGGMAPVSLPENSGLGSSTKEPEQFIPVSQGFFVVGSATGGTVTFNNNQRGFIKETNTNSNTLFKTNSNVVESPDDEIVKDKIQKLRLDITTVTGHKRHLLLGFIGAKATNNYDYGYDGDVIDILPSDAYFKSEDDHKLVIQGVGDFNEESIYPITVISEVTGAIRFDLDELIEMPQTTDIYIYDDLTKTYYDITNEGVTINVEAVGTDESRFSLRFKDNTNSLSVTDFEIESLVVQYVNNDNILSVKNPKQEEIIKNINLRTILGQQVLKWDIENEEQSSIQLPISNLSSGVYLVQLKTLSGKEAVKKIIIN